MMNNKGKIIAGLFFVVLALACVFGLASCVMNLFKKPSNTPAPRITSEIVNNANEAIALATQKYIQYDYDGALKVLEKNKGFANEESEKLKQAITASKGAAKKFTGKFPHIFYHSLIVYPELAFDGDQQAKGYNDWMTTVDEFEKTLTQLYKRGYVLVDLKDYIEADPEKAGEVRFKPIYLPEGKKPLVMSVDDVSYYKYMEKDGFAKKLILKDDGKVYTVVDTPKGKEEITRNGDIVPILDDFVEKYPDFSYKGAKATIALTGYEGVLGYAVEKTDAPDFTQVHAEAKKVADAMKANGWTFASHSFTHNNKDFKQGQITLDQLKYDTERWEQIIGSVVGKTNIFVSPYGVSFKDNDPRYRYLVSSGYNIFCSVGSNMVTLDRGDSVVMERFNIDGVSMTKYKDKINEMFFNVEEVINKNRPAVVIDDISNPK